MKLIMLLCGIILTFHNTSFSQNIVSNKEITEVGRCTGSAYCGACRNCSRCAHCGSGGSCGVCTSNSNYQQEKQQTSRHTKRYNSSRNRSNTSTSINAIRNTNFSRIQISKYNLRKGPSTKFSIIRKISKKDIHKVIANKENWIKVRLNSNLVGYCTKAILNN